MNSTFDPSAPNHVTLSFHKRAWRTQNAFLPEGISSIEAQHYEKTAHDLIRAQHIRQLETVIYDRLVGTHSHLHTEEVELDPPKFLDWLFRRRVKKTIAVKFEVDMIEVLTKIPPNTPDTVMMMAWDLSRTKGIFE